MSRFLGFIKNIEKKIGTLQIIDFILGLFKGNKTLTEECKHKKKREIIEFILIQMKRDLL